jgi:hypothetical protein
MRSNGGGHRVIGDCDNVSGMLGRRSQCGLEAIVISLINRLAQWNSCVL